MSLVLLEMPSDPAAWPEWLERQIVGLDLADLVEQLELVVVPPPGAPITVEAICGAEHRKVLGEGLSPLNAEQIRNLVRHPRSLLALQEQVLIEGGRYWRELPTSVTHSTRVAMQRDKLKRALDDKPQIAPLASTSPRPPSRSSTLRRNLAAAAVVLLTATVVWVGNNQRAPGWGFDKPGLLTAQVPDETYLSSLADAAGAWFNKKPDNSQALTARLEQFRRGCETLLQAPHPQLSETDRTWLLERCGVWKGKLEGHLSDLRTGAKPLDQVQQEADATVTALMNALRTRATAAAA